MMLTSDSLFAFTECMGQLRLFHINFYYTIFHVLKQMSPAKCVIENPASLQDLISVILYLNCEESFTAEQLGLLNEQSVQRHQVISSVTSLKVAMSLSQSTNG